MLKLTVDLALTIQGQRHEYTRDFEVDRQLDSKDLDLGAAQTFRESHMQVLYSRYRPTMSNFQWCFAVQNLFPSYPTIPSQMAAHNNTAETWFQIGNTFLEAAHLMAQARAYHDIETGENDDNLRMLTHLLKVQFFNSAAYTICKIEEWFWTLLFVNSGCSLVPGINVHAPVADWMAEITRGAIYKGLRKRKSKGLCGRFRKSNPYLDGFTDVEYRTIRAVFKKLGKAQSVKAVRKYRNEVAHRGLPAVDYPFFSPNFMFAKKTDRSEVLKIPAGAKVDYQFLDLYEYACAALKHLETQLLIIKAIPVLEPK